MNVSCTIRSSAYAWDFENRLASATLPGSGGTVSFAYDPFGRRISKSSASGTTIYLYDGANTVAEVGPAGVLVASYTQGPGIDQPLAMRRGGNIAYYQADGLGSITSLSGSTGQPVATYTYHAFGATTATEGIFNPYRYTAREQDPETGLYYYRARYYDPSIGRFISEDPINFKGGINFYAYTGNNPVQFVDPFGLWAAGFSIDVSTINPFTSGGGGTYGINVEYTSSGGWGLYTYGTPTNSNSQGFLVGPSAQVNYASGSGPWTGLFQSGSVSGVAVTGSYFQSPAAPGDSGYMGFSLGLGKGLPGLGFTTTNYTQRFPKPAARCKRF